MQHSYPIIESVISLKSSAIRLAGLAFPILILLLLVTTMR
jgi:hypothetical protein